MRLTREKLEPSVNHSSYLRRILLGIFRISEKQYHKKRATDIFSKSADSTSLGGRSTEEKGNPYQAQATRILYVDARNPENRRNDYQDRIGNHIASHYRQHV